jgi:hypothetical protein
VVNNWSIVEGVDLKTIIGVKRHSDNVEFYLNDKTKHGIISKFVVIEDNILVYLNKTIIHNISDLKRFTSVYLEDLQL